MCAHADDRTVHLIGGRAAFELVRMRVGMTNVEAAAFKSVVTCIAAPGAKEKGNSYAGKQLLQRCFAQRHL